MLLLSNQLPIRDIRGLLLSRLCSNMSRFLFCSSIVHCILSKRATEGWNARFLSQSNARHNKQQSCNLQPFVHYFIRARTYLFDNTIWFTIFSTRAGQLKTRQFLADYQLFWSTGYLNWQNATQILMLIIICFTFMIMKRIAPCNDTILITSS